MKFFSNKLIINYKKESSAREESLARPSYFHQYYMSIQNKKSITKFFSNKLLINYKKRK